MTDLGTSEPITIAAPVVSDDARALVDGVLRSGQLAQGPLVARLEDLAADMAGVEHAVAVSSGTDALELAFEVCDIEPGDEVITAPFTFAATANAALRAGATVRFVDIGADFNIDAEQVVGAVGERTRVVCPVHLFGQTADLSAITSIAGRHSLRIVEDAAQAHGAAHEGVPAGSVDLGCFSLYATKNVTTGEGGIVTTADPGAAERLRMLRNQGMAGRYEYRAVGRNARMTDLQAALAVPQLERLDEVTAARRTNAALLNELLAGVYGVELPVVSPGAHHVWHQYTVLLPEGLDRDEVVARMATDHVFCAVYYPAALNDIDLYRDHPRVVVSETPVARDVARRCLSLPIHQGLGPAELERVASAFCRAL